MNTRNFVNETSRHLLITGATGFLGGAIVASLIGEARWSSVLLLVRATDAEEGRARVVEALRRFSVPESLCARVLPDQIICGDLCSVPAFAGDARLNAVSDVINCAAIARPVTKVRLQKRRGFIRSSSQ